MKLEIRKLSCLRQIQSGLIAGLLLAGNAAHAIQFVQKDQFISSGAETLRDEMWIAADSITISGEAQEDLFAAAEKLSLLGHFKGDVWAAGDEAIAAGHFDDQVRLVAKTVQVSGTLAGSLTAIGTTIQLAGTAVLSNNLFCAGEDVITEAAVHGNARIVAMKKATIGGQIDGDLSIAAQEIILLPGTVLNGSLSYTAPNELIPGPAVQINGKITRTLEPPEPFLRPNLAEHFGFAIAALLTGLVFLSLFPHYTAGALASLQTRPRCMMIGFAVLFFLPIIAIVLFVTFFGLPLSLLLILFYLILLYLSKIVVGLAIGALILRRKEISKRNRGTTLATGLLVIYALTAVIPIAWLVNLLVFISGLGALVLALFKKPVLTIQAPADIKTTTEG